MRVRDGVLFSLIFLAANTAAVAVEPASEPYDVEVWADTLFDEAGQVRELAFVDAEKYPKAFLEGVAARLKRAHIPPVTDEGRPATFQTGVRVTLRVTPNDKGGAVAVTGLSVGPLLLQKYFASYPKELITIGGWEGSVSATCTVTVDGTCGSIRVNALPGMPDSVRKFAKASMEGRRFAPQKVAGKAVEGEAEMRVNMKTEDSAPQDFRESKFDRILRNR